MSLINQMLRDLEERRKAENPTAATPDPVDRPVVVSKKGGRWLWLALLGIALGGVGWFVLSDFAARPKLPVAEVVTAPPATDQRALTGKIDQPAGSKENAALTPELQGKPEPAPVLAAPVALVEKPPAAPAQKVRVAEKKPQPTTKPAPAAAPIKKPATAKAAAEKGKLNITSAAGAKAASLEAIGIVEGIDSVRLMFEFEKLPAYRVRSVNEQGDKLTVSFSATGTGARFEIPPFRGPLLQDLQIGADPQDLQLSVAVGRPVKVQAYSLPADGVHGDRLLLELSEDRQAVALARKNSQATMGERLRTQKGLDGGDAEDPKEQADALFRKALRYLEQGNEGAAKVQFAKVLELTPANVDVRLRLVDLMLKRQQDEPAEDLLIAGLTLAPESPELRTAYGRFLLDHEQMGEALNLMRSKPVPELAAQPDYHALLAALEQENGQFANAATRYRELLQIRPERAEWWMMLGIAYEQLQDLKLANSAYRQALDKAGLSAEHRKFALERLERLQRLQK